MRVVTLMLLEAIRADATEFSLEPQHREYSFRYRGDGQWRQSPYPPPLRLQQEINDRLCLMAGLEDAGSHDGRIHLQLAGKDHHIRVHRESVPAGTRWSFRR